MANSAENLQVIVPYCERLATGSEPINTISNAGFVLVVVYGWTLWRRQDKVVSASNAHEQITPVAVVAPRPPRVAMYCLLILPLMIAAGSALFHAMPGHITHLLDIVPVCTFALLTFWLCLRRYQWANWKITSLLIAWIGATAIAAGWPEVLAHSLFYLPTLVILVFLALTLKQQQTRLTLLAITFACALLFRAIDLPLCALEVNPGLVASDAAANSPGLAGSVGTHFLWHVLTALACILCLQLVLGHPGRRADKRNL